MTRLKQTRAFTLIELIVVIVIIGILAAIAAVAYNQFIANAEATSVETGADQVVRALTAEQVFTQRPVEFVGGAVGNQFTATTIETYDKNANDYVPASTELLNDLNSAVNNNTLVVDAAAGTITITDGSYQCVIAENTLAKTCSNV